MPSGKFYTTSDVAVIREIYPKHGSKPCADRLGRSERAIRTFASKVGILRDAEVLKIERRVWVEEKFNGEAPV